MAENNPKHISLFAKLEPAEIQKISAFICSEKYRPLFLVNDTGYFEWVVNLKEEMLFAADRNGQPITPISINFLSKKYNDSINLVY
jgi:hypothetical protein